MKVKLFICQDFYDSMSMVPDIPVDHWMCSFWQTQDCSAGNNGFWMHGTVGNNGCTGRFVGKADGECVCGNPGCTGGRSLELRPQGTSTCPTDDPNGPNSLKLDPLTGEILNPLPCSVVDRRHWRQQKETFFFGPMLKSTCFRKGPRTPWYHFLKLECKK